MSWLNTPKAIVEDLRYAKETQSYWFDPLGISPQQYTRSRTVTYTTTRYVGCHYAAAKVYAAALAALSGHDVHVVPASGGQYHVLDTTTVNGVWSAWA